MFPQLAEELEYMIWKSFWSIYVLKEVKEKDSIWRYPSDDLLEMTKGWGTIQIRHTDHERVLLKNNKATFRNLHYHWCLLDTCIRCLDDGFPCWYAVYYGGMPERMMNHWDISFYKN